jgi:pimeloyl-ACP methyl ester carboxylesterase
MKSMEDFGKTAVRMALSRCPEGKVVLLGVSLGATLAARSTSADAVAGMVLVSAGASLSSVVRTRLKSKWYLAPLTVLPLEVILQNDYALMELLLPGIPIVIFQGSADSQTPISVGFSGSAPQVRCAAAEWGRYAALKHIACGVCSSASARTMRSVRSL